MSFTVRLGNRIAKDVRAVPVGECRKVRLRRHAAFGNGRVDGAIELAERLRVALGMAGGKRRPGLGRRLEQARIAVQRLVRAVAMTEP